MTPLEIAIISIIGGAFTMLLLAAMGFTIWTNIRAKAAVDKLQQQVNTVYAETAAALVKQAIDLTAIMESAKSNFKAIREEMRGSQAETLRETRATLETHRAEMTKIINTINGVRFIESAKQITKASAILWRVAKRLEVITEAEPQEFVASEEGNERARAWPAERAEEFAPDGETIYDHTQVVRAEREEEAEEQAEQL